VILSKILKSVFLLIVLQFFILSLYLLQAYITSSNTLFSADYFIEVFDENDMAGNIAILFEKTISQNTGKIVPENGTAIEGEGKTEVVENSQEALDMTESFQKHFEENIDSEWIDTEISNVMEGVFSYFFGDAENLPEINIVPVKEAFVQVMIDRLVSESDPDSLSKTETLIFCVKNMIKCYSADGTVNDRVVESVKYIEWFRDADLSREAIERIAEKIAVMDRDNLSTEDIRDYVISEMVKDRLNYYEIKDTLDLTLLFETMYGTKDNPVSGAASLFDTIQNKIQSLIVSVTILLILIISITALYPRSILRWLGAGIIVSASGILILCLFAETFTQTFMKSHLNMQTVGQGADGIFLQNWVLSYSGGIFKWLLIQAFILLLTGILLITASYFVPKRLEILKAMSETKTGALLSGGEGRIMVNAVRVLAVILLMVGIAASIAIHSVAIAASVNEYTALVEKKGKNTMDTGEAIGRVLNAQELYALVRDTSKENG